MRRFWAFLCVALATLSLAAPPVAAQNVGGVQLPVLNGAADPFPGASVGLAFTSNQYKAGGVTTGNFASLPGVTVTRASGGYAEDLTGALTWFGANQARITNKGLLVEEARTNLLLWSQVFQNGAWAGTTVTAADNQGVAPDGTQTASLLTATGANSNWHQSFTAAASTTYVFSLYVKANTAGITSALNLYANSGASPIATTAFTTTGAWQRVTVSGNTASLVAPFWATIGGGGAFSTGQTMLVWGADLEQAVFATSYIPTTTAAVTRAADAVVIGGLNIAGDFTAITRAAAPPVVASTFPRVLRVDDGTNSNMADLYYGGATTITAGSVVVGGTSSFTTGGFNATPGNFYGFAMARAGNAVNYVFAGPAYTNTVTGASAPPFNVMRLGSDPGHPLNGFIASAVLYPTALSNAQMVSATTTDTSSLSLNFTAGSYKTTTPYVRTNWLKYGNDLTGGGGWSPISGAVINGPNSVTLSSTLNSRIEASTVSTVGQPWTYSSYLSGSGTIQLALVDGGGAFGATTLSVTLTPTPTRYFVQRTMNDASASTVIARLNNVSGSAATVVVSNQMLEQGTAAPSSYISTSGSTASVATTSSTNLADIAPLTVTRASPGYASDSAGNLILFGSNVPRITDQGLLVEEARTNSLFPSAPVSMPGGSNAWNGNYSGNAVTVVANDRAAPDGTLTALRVTTPGISTADGIYYRSTTIPANSSAWTCSAWVYSAAGGNMRIGLGDTPGSTAWTNGTNFNIISVPASTWTRLSITQTALSSVTASSVTCIVTGTSAAVTTFWVWGVQYEQGAFPTSYIATAGAAATRVADVVSLSGLNIAPGFAMGAQVTGAPLASSTFPTVAQVDDGTAANAALLYQSGVDGAVRYKATATSTQLYDNLAGAAQTPSSVFGEAARFNAGSYSAAVAGALGTPSASATALPVLSTLRLGTGVSGNAARNSYIQQIRLYPYAANDNELAYRSAGNW